MAESQVSTQNIISFLQQPSSYPHQPAEVKILQTHASVLAIAPPFVYKVKKHINLTFLDFTSLTERKKNCEREMQLNSRFCAGLYLGVLSISLKDNKLVFGEEGIIVEYALQMNQLPDGYFLDQLLKANQVNRHTLDLILKILKDFYDKTQPEPPGGTYGSLANIRNITEENLTGLQQHPGNFQEQESLEIIKQYFNRFFEVNQHLFRKRVQEHKILDCHGDLHLDHIHIRQGKVCIFDCIEFNDRFRFIDVASDIAFLAMDFDFQDRPDLAAYLTDRMAELLQDPDMILLTDFYKCYRACVRAKVEYIKSQELEVSPAERQLSREKVERYLSLALSYALFGSRPAVLLVCGRSGTGKSTLAKNLAGMFNWKHLSSDVVRKVKAGLPVYQRPDPEKRKGLYSRQVTDEVYQTLLDETMSLVKNKNNIILDATFGHEKHRAMFGEALSHLKVPFYFVELRTSDDVIKKRLAQRDHTNQVVSDARLEDFDLLRQLYQAPAEIFPSHLITLNANLGAQQIVMELLKQLAQLNNQKKSVMNSQ